MKIRFRARSVAFISLLGACAPDLSLLDSQTGSDDDDVSKAGEHAGAAMDEPKAGRSGGGTGSGGANNGGSPGIPGAAGDASVGTEQAGAGGADTTPSTGGADPVPMTSCVPRGAERCNAVDDDCNGTIDDGCPAGVSTTFEQDLPLLGDSPGGAISKDDCKDGEALTGLTLAWGAFLSQMRGICRPISLVLAPSGQYLLQLGTARQLAPHPTNSADAAQTLSCADSEAVVGLRIAQQHYTLGSGDVIAVTTRVWLTCAKLQLADVDGQPGLAWQGARETAPLSGSYANGTAWLASSAAPAGAFATRLLGSSGAWVDRLGFGVSRASVVVH